MRGTPDGTALAALGRDGSERSAMHEPARETPVLGHYEVVVLGGGPAGIMAATAAARCGRSTVLVERYGFLGGAGTAGGLSTFCGLHANVYGEHTQVVHGLADELLGRIATLGGLSEPHLSFANRITALAYDIPAYQIAADELVGGSGAKLLFHTLAVGAVLDAPGRIGALLVESKSGRGALKGEIFVDCSGDADLSAWAGVAYELGDGAGGMLYPSLMFRVNGVDHTRAGRAWELVPPLMRAAEEEGSWRFARTSGVIRPQRNPLEWRVNFTQLANPDGSPVDGTDAEQLAYGEIEGRRQVRNVAEFLRARVPGFEESYVVEIATQIGIRETRRIRGLYELSEQDILGCADFDDSIGVNGWPVEAHVAGGIVIRWPTDPDGRGFNQLPFRMIVPEGVDNLFVAGRCASMSHEGQSSARVSGPCFVMGQAAGVAADLALGSGLVQLACSEVDVPQLQKHLEDAGAFLGAP